MYWPPRSVHHYNAHAPADILDLLVQVKLKATLTVPKRLVDICIWLKLAHKHWADAKQMFVGFPGKAQFDLLRAMFQIIGDTQMYPRSLRKEKNTMPRTTDQCR